ncbi:MAG: hypothetical protein HYR74_04450 [Candidatus Eisenbacteria bacterium]|nr:hypothetical protein [Candidatus Eisenbacteria bacterium]
MRAARALVLLAGCLAILAAPARRPDAATDPRAAADPHAAAAPADSSILTLAGPDEPGMRMVVTGRVLERDGKTPAARLRVGVYHTDASGRYGVHRTRRSFPPVRDARLSGWLVTTADGRFEVRTVRPGPYPGSRTPAHIHFIVRERPRRGLLRAIAGGPGDVAFELRFADDPLLRRRGLFPAETLLVSVRPVDVDAGGVQHVSVDLRMR